MPSATDLSSSRPTGQLDAEQLGKLPRLVPRRKATPPTNPVPVPATPPLPPPPDISSTPFTKPTRRILSPQDHQLFLKSPTCDLILAFVFSLADAATGKTISSVSAAPQSPIITQLLHILDEIEALVKLSPPEDQGGSRFGNPAFRRFCDLVASSSGHWHRELLSVTNDAAIVEISTYLEHSFGNRARIDYGSGHELNFAIWLLCLNRLSLLPPSTFSAVALLLFPRYIRLLRVVQGSYYLEPAGSHGVWGLDDYQFLPFLLGAAQLRGNEAGLRPLSIHSSLALDEAGDDYLYLDMVRFTLASKTVKGLKWTQPMLDDISGARSWEKVEQGMRRMFVKEVLEKLPIMQHFLFGSLVPAVDGMSREEDYDDEENHGSGDAQSTHSYSHDHNHDDNAWGDPCGIRIPSTVAASEEAAKQGRKETLRRVPFD